MREIEFRQWVHGKAYSWGVGVDGCQFVSPTSGTGINAKNTIHEQYTGLRDIKGGGLLKVFEGDIIDINGKIIGSVHEIQPRDTDLVIPRMGTKAWGLAYKEAMARGFDFAE